MSTTDGFFHSFYQIDTFKMIYFNHKQKTKQNEHMSEIDFTPEQQMNTKLFSLLYLNGTTPELLMI